LEINTRVNQTTLARMENKVLIRAEYVCSAAPSGLVNGDFRILPNGFNTYYDLFHNFFAI
jgi:hypothetical protein